MFPINVMSDYIKTDVMFTGVCLYGNWAAINQFPELRFNYESSNCESVTFKLNAKHIEVRQRMKVFAASISDVRFMPFCSLASGLVN